MKHLIIGKSLQTLFSLETVESIRIYDILTAIEATEGTTYCQIGLEKFKFLMEWEDEDFKPELISSAVKEINEKTELNVYYEINEDSIEFFF